MKGLNFLIVAAVLTASSTAHGADYNSCKARCEDYTKITAKDYKPKVGEPVIDPKDIPILQAHCDTLSGMDNGFELQQAATIAMTAGAATCGALCALGAATIVDKFDADIACSFVGMGVMALDVASSINLTVQG